MGNNAAKTRVKDLLISCREPIVILSHPFPDGDSVGSTLGLYYLLRAMGVHSVPVLPEPVPAVYRFLTGDVEIFSPPVDVRGKTVVILDCSDLKRLHQTGQSLDGAARVINIDHHLNNDMFGDYNYVDSAAAAVGQIIYEIFAPSPVTSAAAQALFTAIYTDTGRFSYSNTQPRTLETAAKLVKLGADPQFIFNQIYQTRSREYYSFLAEALAKMHLSCNNCVASISLDRKMFSRFHLEDWELDDLNDYPRSLKGVIVSAIIKEVEENTVKVSLRSKNEFNVAEIARDFGGGGHRNAAGATLNMALVQAEALVRSRLEEEFEQ